MNWSFLFFRLSYDLNIYGSGFPGLSRVEVKNYDYTGY